VEFQEESRGSITIDYLRVEAWKNPIPNLRWILSYVKYWVARKGKDSILLVFLLFHILVENIEVGY
jgi:hypothetical protein